MHTITLGTALPTHVRADTITEGRRHGWQPQHRTGGISRSLTTGWAWSITRTYHGHYQVAFVQLGGKPNRLITQVVGGAPVTFATEAEAKGWVEAYEDAVLAR